MPGHKYKGYTNDGRPLKIAFDVDGDDTPAMEAPDEQRWIQRLTIPVWARVCAS